MKEWLRHRINPLHIYCRICKRIGRRRALVIAKAYEVIVYSVTLGPNAERGSVLW